jgi:putative tryptophan/tyrosine transport system substrate-binding protein
MNRRDLVVALGGTAIAWPLGARAQKAMPVIGWLGNSSPSAGSWSVAAFLQGLPEIGYVEGQNLAIEYRWSEDHYERLAAFADDLVRLKIDLIVTGGAAPSARAAKNATSTIPIVFTAVGDPVAAGLVASLARPGGNITGISILTDDLTPKRLQIISELVPRAKTIAFLVNPTNAQNESVTRQLQQTADATGMQLSVLKASTEQEIDAAFVTLLNLRAEALVVGGDPFFTSRRDQIIALALRHAVPAIYFAREYIASGGLMSYGPNLPASYRQAGVYAGKILKGAKPADLPVEQPTKFEFVINLKTAKALGLTVPQSLLARADEVIE